MRREFSRNSGGNRLPLCGDDKTSGYLISPVLNSSKIFEDEKDKLNERKIEILELLENKSTEDSQKKELEKELSDIIIRLAKIR